MKVFLQTKTPNRASWQRRLTQLGCMMLFLLIGANINPILAEGSKDFVGYQGYRMFLDTRDAQQLKVYAGVGETINFGSSHVGIQGGFIKIYDPSGNLVDSLDGSGASPLQNRGIIFNSTQELAGPTGGGSTMGTGYEPGTVTVGAGQEGVWTVVFDYPSYSNASFINILNNASWTRGANQPNSRRVVLAWDITVTQGGAGNEGGSPVEGRVYSNEHISLINGNGFNTSPTFYVLTKDGFQYQVNINGADPFRFPISSNSLGLVDGDLNPVYKSKMESAFTRSADTSTWTSNELYLYEPQAEDEGALVNNKIFFNEPSSDLPAFANVTDIFRENPHQTWLLEELDTLVLDSTYLGGYSNSGLPCSIGTIEFEKGGYFYFETNIGGSITLQLDLNNNGSFDDPIDTTLMGFLNGGLDSIFWSGFNGLGEPVPVQNGFQINYQGSIRYGEIHIALTDVEGSENGITFEWMNAPVGYPTDQFYYDHSDIFPSDPNAVSGGGAPGDAQPTNVPFIYPLFQGNDNYIDQWSFVEFQINSTAIEVNVVIDCECANGSPELAVTGGGDICEGDDLILTATNSVTGVGELTYTWSGPAGFSFIQNNVGELETSTAALPGPVSALNGGTYIVIAENANGCTDTVEIEVNVNLLPNISSITGGGDYCAGDDVVLTASNINALPGETTDYTWTLPNGDIQNGSVTGTDVITLNINSINASNDGTVSLSLTTNGCTGGPFTTDLTVNPAPVLSTDSPTVGVCENDDVQLCATNSTPGIGSMTCTWSGPNGFFSEETVGGDDDICLNLTNVDNSFEGTYTLVCTFNGCESEPLEITLDVQSAPEINGISPSGDFCVGEDVMFTAQNVTMGTGPLDYTWFDPAGDSIFSGSGPELGPFPFPLENVQVSDAGTYTLVLTTSAGCESVPQTTTIIVLPAPEVCNVTGGGDACVGQDVTLAAFNCAADVLPVNWTWTGPNGLVETNTSTDDGPYELVLTDVQDDDSGTYCITITSNVNNCVSEEFCVELNVLPGLNVVDITPDSTYCDGTDVVLTGTSTLGAGTIEYSWTSPSGDLLCGPITINFDEALSCTILDLSPADTGIYILNASSDAGCSFGPHEVYVGIFPSADIVEVTGGGELCSDDDVVLNGTGMGTAASVDYTWISPSGEDVTGTPSMGIPVEGPFPGLDTTPEAGTYTLTVTSPDGCIDEATVEVTLGCTPEAVIVNTDSTLCENDTLTLCGQNLNPDCGIIDYTWETPNGISITGSANGTDIFCDELFPLSTYGSGTYSLIINSGDCQSIAATVEITLNPNPIISVLSGGGTYCAGDTALVCFEQLNPAIDSFFYTCNIGSTQVTNAAATGDVVCLEITGNAGDSIFVFCSVESFEGCVSSLEGTEVTFDSGFDLTATAETPVCSNETLELNGSNAEPCTGDVNYQWIDPMGDIVFTGTAPCEGPFPASVNDPVSGDYCLVVAAAGSSCTDTACVEVEVLPAPEVTQGIDGGGTFCEGESTILTATIEKDGGGDIDYVWTLDGTPVDSGTATSGDEVTLDLGTLDLDESGEYCLELTCPANGCTNDPPSCTTVTVNEQPDITEISGDGTYCEGVDVALTASGTPGPGDVTYTWDGPNFTFTGTAPCGGPYDATISDIQQNQAGLYTLTVEKEGSNGNVCVVEETITINVNPTPIVSIELEPLVCEGEETTITITVDPNNAASVDWMLSGPALSESGTVTELTTLTFTIVANEGDMYTLSATSDQGCEAEVANATVTTVQIPTPVLSASPNPLCPGDPLQLTTQEQAGDEVSYCWFLNGALIEVTDEPIFDIFDPQAGEYSVQAKVDECVADSEPVTVTILSAPDAVDDVYETMVDVSLEGNVTDNDSPSAGVTVTVVQGPSNGNLTLNDDGTFTYTPNPGFAGTDSYTYQTCLIECPELCDEATVTITVTPTECIIPNVITPNGDGVNDVLIINCVPFNPNNSLKIYNRWGDEIFVAEPYENDWDGTIDGEVVPVSTYFFLWLPDRDTDDEQQAGYIRVHR